MFLSCWDFLLVWSSVEEVEIRACLAGLYVAMAMHKPIILETDCLSVKKILSDNVSDRLLMRLPSLL